MTKWEHTLSTEKYTKWSIKAKRKENTFGTNGPDSPIKSEVKGIKTTMGGKYILPYHFSSSTIPT